MFGTVLGFQCSRIVRSRVQSLFLHGVVERESYDARQPEMRLGW
jgi:hypothetical protein